jgi:hypothetical protein
MTSPDLARVVGRTEAIFLQQLHYWLTSDKSHGFFYENKRWVYNTYQDWQEQIKIVSSNQLINCSNFNMGIYLINIQKESKSIDWTKLVKM